MGANKKKRTLKPPHIILSRRPTSRDYNMHSDVMEYIYFFPKTKIYSVTTLHRPHAS